MQQTAPMQDLTPRRQDVHVPYELHPIGVVRSQLKDRGSAPRRGDEGAPDAWIELTTSLDEALEGIEAGDELFVITWLHEAERDVLKVHPRSDERIPLTGVFATRSPDRPNPLGLHRVTPARSLAES